MRVLLAILLCIGSISYAEDRTISITGNSINDNSNDIRIVEDTHWITFSSSVVDRYDMMIFGDEYLRAAVDNNDILEWVIVGASATHEAGGFLRYLIIRNM